MVLTRNSGLPSGATDEQAIVSAVLLVGRVNVLLVVLFEGERSVGLFETVLLLLLLSVVLASLLPGAVPPSDVGRDTPDRCSRMSGDSRLFTMGGLLMGGVCDGVERWRDVAAENTLLVRFCRTERFNATAAEGDEIGVVMHLLDERGLAKCGRTQEDWSSLCICGRGSTSIKGTAGNFPLGNDFL